MYARQNYCYNGPEERGKTLATVANGGTIRIKALDWHNTNEKCVVVESDESSGDSGAAAAPGSEETQFVIYLFGITEYGETATVRLNGFTPYFYIKLPAGMTDAMFMRIFKEPRILSPNFHNAKTGKNPYEYYKKDMLNVSFCDKMDFWGFNNGAQTHFARLTFRNTYAMKAYERAFEKPVVMPPATATAAMDTKISFALYESNMDPMIRFFHWRNLEPCGWLEVSNYTYNKTNDFSIANFELVAHWKSVSALAVPMLTMGRVVEAAFDIECDSDDGCFPLAQKDWNKIVRPLIDEFVSASASAAPPEHRVCQYIIERLQQGHLVLKEGFSGSGSGSGIEELFDQGKNRAVINEFFKKLTDATIQRRSDLRSDKKSIDEKIEKLREQLVKFLNEMLPPLQGDKCIQIGTTVQIYGMESAAAQMDFIFTLKSAVIPERPDVIVQSFETEEEVLLEFTKLLQQLDPDVLTGYNIFGFDMKFLHQRAQELHIESQFLRMGRLSDQVCKFKVQDMSSSAMGTNILEYIEMSGRVCFDLLKYMRRNHNLEAYTLDSVVANIMRADVSKVETDMSGTWLYSELTEGIAVGNFITMQKNNYIYEDKYNGGAKMEIVAVDKVKGCFLVRDDIQMTPGWYYSWSEGKDDIGPQEIFLYQKKGARDRGLIAKYCLQDCRLCNRLITKLDVLSNSVAMANVNSVPLSYIFNRGQGVKLFSFVAKQARVRGYCVPTRKNDTEGGSADQDDTYEGAFVLEPKKGIYFETEPIAVADFNSLYPSCMMSENLCYTSICLDKKYQGAEGAALLTRLGHTFEDVSWDIYDTADEDKVVGQQVVRFVQQQPGQPRGVLPEILEVLLKCRKDVRAEQKKTKDKQKWKVMEGQQLAYKTTANSLYGFTGAGTSKLCLKWIAAATTAIGRKNIMFAKHFVEREYPGTQVVYGDTDSIFIKFPMEGRRGLEAIHHAIDLCEEAAGRISQQLKRPHNLEFEKVICPMILAAKKKYVGLFYSSKSPKYVIKYMGIVLKRRDNAPIVKYVFGEMIEILLKENDLPKAVGFVQEACRRILRGEYSLDKFIMSKSLRDGYKNPEGIAHKVLADRMGERDPGTKPRVNDRVPFVYVEQKTHIKGTKTGVQKVLQGEKIEHPDYVVAHKLPVDYLHYITNQIMNPVCQVLNLVMKDAEKVVFRDIIAAEEQRRQTKAILKSGCQDITKFFKKNVI